MTVEERAARLAQEIGIDSGAFLGEYEPKIADALRAAASEARQEALEGELEEAEEEEKQLRGLLRRMIAWVPHSLCNCQGDYVCPLDESIRNLRAIGPAREATSSTDGKKVGNG